MTARGSTYTWTATVRDAGGDLADAPDLTISIADPNDDVLVGFPEAIPPVVHDSLGKYHYDWAVAGDALLGTYTATWAGTVDAAVVTSTDTVEVTTGSISGHFLELTDIPASARGGLSDADLTGVLRREEAWLVRRIGALEGERTQLVYRTDPFLDDPVYLGRPTDAVAVMDNETDLDEADVRLLDDGWAFERVSDAFSGPTIAVTFTPNDAEEVRRVLIELVRLTATDTGYLSEQIGEYQYSRGGSRSANPAFLAASTREVLLRELRRPGRYGTVRLPTGLMSERVGAVQ